MAASVQEIGLERNRVLVVDDFMDEPHLLIRQAKAMAPFPSEDITYYPGRRRLITPADVATELHVNESLEALAPLIGQVFGLRNFMPVEASFSLVTKRPQDLSPAQRLPHYDKTDPDSSPCCTISARSLRAVPASTVIAPRHSNAFRRSAKAPTPWRAARKARRPASLRHAISASPMPI